MKKKLTLKFNRNLLKIIFFISFLITPSYASFKNTINNTNSIENKNNQELEAKTSIQSKYLLGGGDVLAITFFGIDIFDGNYAINSDGNLNLPEIGFINAEGYSLEEFINVLKKRYKDVIKDPNINVSLAYFRPVNIFINGEVKIPGLYNFDPNKISINYSTGDKSVSTSENRFREPNKTSLINSPPRIFDVIKKAQGVTNYANLSEINIFRNHSIEQGGGKIKAKINFL